MDFRLPDYGRSSLSVTASLCAHFGGSAAYPRLPELDQELRAGGIDKIVLVLADGMGEYPLRRHLPASSFLVRSDKAAVSAVYPSTTAAATTSLWTGLSPIEHGWLGWSLYFKECARQLDVFPGTESYLGDRYPLGSPAPLLMPLPKFPPVGAETHLIFPFQSHAMQCARFGHVANGLRDSLSLASRLCALPGKRLIGIYTPEPDHTMHEKGVYAPEAAAKFREVDRELERFASHLPSDTLLVVTADHGLTDCVTPVMLNEIASIDRCLWMPPAMEGRASALYVKPFRRSEFEREFRAVCGEDFLLFPREEALKAGLFGPGTPHPKAEDFLGDYIACAAGKRYLRYDTLSCRAPEMVARHAGLTPEEMTVPVILQRGN